MFSNEHDELFHLLSTPPHQQAIPESKFIITAMPNISDSPKPKSSRKRKPSIAFSDNIQDYESPVEHRKRIIHRDGERQRRQEMANLYRSLRSLIPDVYLQGKKSISDHIHETVKYIKHLNRKVEKLMNQRDQLEQPMKHGCNFRNLSEFSLSHKKNNVTVKSSPTGMQIILKITLRGGLLLSKFLSVLNGEGLAVTNCISTKVNAGYLHVIESEVDEGRSVDQNKLQKKLRDLVHDL